MEEGVKEALDRMYWPCRFVYCPHGENERCEEIDKFSGRGDIPPDQNLIQSGSSWAHASQKGPGRLIVKCDGATDPLFEVDYPILPTG